MKKNTLNISMNTLTIDIFQIQEIWLTNSTKKLRIKQLNVEMMMPSMSSISKNDFSFLLRINQIEEINRFFPFFRLSTN